MLDKKVLYFMRVVECGSFSGAARELFLSQSAISQQITLLEDEVGIALFDRSGYKPILTEGGRHFYDECRRIQAECSELIESLKEGEEKIRIGFTGIYENRKIIKLVNEFRQTATTCNIELIDGSFDECVMRLNSGELGVAFGPECEFRGEKGIAYKKLYEYDICVICSFSHPLADRQLLIVDDIKNETYILLSKKFGKQLYKNEMQAFMQDGYTPKIKQTVDSFEKLILLVSIGEGISITCKEVVRESEVRVIDLEGTHHKSSYVVAWNEQNFSEGIRQFIDKTEQYFKTL